MLETLIWHTTGSVIKWISILTLLGHVAKFHKKASPMRVSVENLFEVCNFHVTQIVEYVCPCWSTVRYNFVGLFANVSWTSLNERWSKKKPCPLSQPLVPAPVNTTSIHERRTHLYRKFFQIMLTPGPRFHYLLTDARNMTVELCKPKTFLQPCTRIRIR